MIRGGGEARLLYLAWRYGGEDPYRLFNALDKDYCPIEGGPPARPLFPHRIRSFIYACGGLANEEAIKLAGGK